MTSSEAVGSLLAKLQPELVVHTAAEVGGIQARIDEPTRFLLSNALMDANLISLALRAEVPRLITIGSAAMYPAESSQPINENALLTGAFESASEGYGLAKAMSTKAVEYIAHEYGLAYRTLIPSNIYGSEPLKHGGGAHLIAAALDKVQGAVAAGDQAVTIWGDGQSRREFIFADDLADWIARSVDDIADWPVAMNIGFGVDYSIQQYYEWAAEAVGFLGRFDFDASKPNGVRKRLLDSSRARAHGWSPSTAPLDGMKQILASGKGLTR